jgi:hypothetical protein
MAVLMVATRAATMVALSAEKRADGMAVKMDVLTVVRRVDHWAVLLADKTAGLMGQWSVAMMVVPMVC